MAPFPLFFNIHTDRWGNHRIRNPSIPKAIGGFLTDLWGSHRGGPTPAPAATGEVVMKRSIEYGQGAHWLLVKIFTTMIPTWWSVLFVIDLVVVLVFVLFFFFYPRAGCPQVRRRKEEHEEQRLLVVGVVKMESKDGKNMWV